LLLKLDLVYRLWKVQEQKHWNWNGCNGSGLCRLY